MAAARDRVRQARIVDGLEQVVERMHFEGVHPEGAVRGHKNDQRRIGQRSQA
ncbi:hypothetical protein LP420_16365 [Massilia sp. B-10]|nr:hypothetical protein LP420_16365 [Massilia sp. B-10]